MKMRASLLQFVTVLVGVVLIAIAGLTLAHRNVAKHAQVEGQSRDLSAVSCQIATEYGRLPLSFEANMGQTAPEVQFLSQGSGYELFLTPREAVLALRHSKAVGVSRLNRAGYLAELRNARRRAGSSVLRLQFAGANPTTEISGLNPLPGRTDYFIGNDPKNWRTNVPSYGKVAYRGLYSGIDAVFYGDHRQLEYDFVVAPGADPTQIALNVEGANSLTIDASGNLLMNIAESDVRLLKPTVYQDVDRQRRAIAANYVIGSGHRVSFSIAGYDTSKPLVIDPVLDYSTYLGGSAGSATYHLFDSAYGIAVDSAGDAYVTGATFSSLFPTTSNITLPDPQVGTNGAVFVTEMNPGGTGETYSTYLSGNGGETGYGIALDSAGKIYVAGQTFSSNFPKTGTGTNGFEPNPTSSANLSTLGTGFIVKIDPIQTGSNALVYSSYLGGSDGDFARSIAADSSGNAYVVGFTISSDFPVTTPTANGYQTAPTGIAGNAFLVRVDTKQTGAASLIYSTYLGGDGKDSAALGYGDLAFGVAADSSNNAYLVGETTSSNFPTVNGLPFANSSTSAGEGFVSRLDTTKSGTNSLIYSGYLGGESFDIVTAVALEPGNSTPGNAVYVTGQTQSTQFPQVPKNQPIVKNSPSTGLAFVTVLNTTPGSTAVTYSQFLGGAGGDEGNGIQVDSSGNAYVVGTTGSSSSTSPFPTTAGAFQTSNNNANGTAFVFELNPGGNGTADLLYSTYFGGSGNNAGDLGLGIALDPSNNVYITGGTGSTTNFPISANAFQPAMTHPDPAAVTSAFVAELTLQPTLSFSATTLAFGNETLGVTATTCGQLTTCEVTLTNNTSAAIPITVGAITGATGFTALAPSCGAPAMVPVGGNCTIAVTFDPTSVGAEVGTLPISFTAGNNTTASTQNITLTGTGTNFTVQPTSLTFPFQLITSTSAPPQTVTLTNSSPAAISFTTSASAGFAESDTCNQMVAANSACMLSVTFTPPAAGPATGTLTVTSAGINETVQLSGNGGDFSVTMPASINVTNNSGSGTATLAWTSGFTSPPSVSFSCTTTITNLSCSVPNPVAAAGSFTINVTGSAAVPPASRRFDVWKTPIVPVTVTILALLTLPLLRRRRAWLGFAAVVLACALFSACSGGHTAQTGSLTLTGSATSGSTTVSHPFSTSVTVQ